MRHVLPVLLLTACAAFCQQAATDNPATRISGRVVTLADAPIPRAVIEIRTANPTSAQDLRNGTRVTADDEGNFVAEGIPPGSHYVIAQKPGFVNQYYASRTPGSSGAPLTLKAGQTIANVTIHMTPQSVISGIVTDPNGDPVVGTTVTLLRISYAQVRKGIAMAGTIRTNDKGEFRIANVAPGRYHLSVGDSEFEALQDKPVEKNLAAERLVTTFYPSAITLASAKLLEIAAGADLTGMNIRMRREKTYTIRATVVDESGMPLPNAALTIWDKNGTSTSAIAQQVSPPRSANGKFEFPGLLPGNYALIVPNPPTLPDRNGFPPVLPLKGRAEVDVINQDVTVEVRVAPGAEITGAVRAEEDAVDPLKKATGLRVGMIEYVIPGYNNRSAVVQPEGKFELKDVAKSTYAVGLSGLPPGLYFKSVRFGGTDVTRKPFELSSGGTIDILVSAKAADVSGAVRDAEGVGMVGISIVLWPANDQGSDIRGGGRFASSDASGGFRFDNLPPGDYYLAAWEQTEGGITENPDFRALFTSDAKKVKLEESMHYTGEPKIISIERTKAQMAKLP